MHFRVVCYVAARLLFEVCITNEPGEVIRKSRLEEGRGNLLELFFLQSCVKTFPLSFENHSKRSAAHPKIKLWHNISASHSWTLPGMFLHYSVHVSENLIRHFIKSCFYSMAFYDPTSSKFSVSKREGGNKVRRERQQPGRGLIWKLGAEVASLGNSNALPLIHVM